MQNGFDALFVTCAELVEELSSAGRDGRLRDTLARFVKPHVLVVDEVGYLACGDDALGRNAERIAEAREDL